MTDRLFLNDPYLMRFDAQVSGQRELGGRPAVVLNRTAFFPEGGGQPADRGTIGGIQVADVQEVDGELLHLLDGPAPHGPVTCVVDWARRFDHMQQHHGQHLLSAAFEQGHGAKTVSFHLGTEVCTIDLDVPAARLDSKTLRAAEETANQLVWRNLPVETRDFSPEELATMALRKDPTKGSRVVVVKDVDASPCGGTHPHRTAEVGAIAILDAARWGNGARVEFVCGGRVVAALATTGQRLSRASQVLRCSPAELPEGVARMAEELQARRKELERLLVALADAEAERLAISEPGVVAIRLEGALAAAAGLRAVGQALAARGRIALLGGANEGGAYLCFVRPRGPGAHLGELLRHAVAQLGGKGGGSPDMAQGGGPEVSRLDEVLAEAKAKLGSP